MTSGECEFRSYHGLLWPRTRSVLNVESIRRSVVLKRGIMDDRIVATTSDTPVYTIKTVVQETGITPASLRAWERRYRVLSPGRSESGYRLYSERDIAVLRWLKSQVDGGVAISRAVALLETQHAAGVHPELAYASMSRLEAGRLAERAGTARDLATIRDDLVQALLAFREQEAELTLSEAFALYPVDSVVEDLVVPALVEIGDLWQGKQASVSQEHFATLVLQRRLLALHAVYAPARSGPVALVGAAPGELHDVGALLVSMALRRAGWRVISLGQNLPSEEWSGEIARIRPELVCISSATAASAREIHPIYEAFFALPGQRAAFALGGQAFERHPELRILFPRAVFASTAFRLPSTLAEG